MEHLLFANTLPSTYKCVSYLRSHPRNAYEVGISMIIKGSANLQVYPALRKTIKLSN